MEPLDTEEFSELFTAAADQVEEADKILRTSNSLLTKVDLVSYHHKSQKNWHEEVKDDNLFRDRTELLHSVTPYIAHINGFFAEVRSSFEVLVQVLNQLSDSPTDVGDINYFSIFNSGLDDELREKGLDDLVDHLLKIKNSDELRYVNKYRNSNIHHFDHSAIYSEQVGGDPESGDPPRHQFIDLLLPVNPANNWWDWEHMRAPNQPNLASQKLEELKGWYDEEVRQLVEEELPTAFEEIFDLR